MTSTDRKQREVDAYIQLSLSCFMSMGLQPMGWCSSHSGWVFSAQVTLPEISLTDIAKGVPHGCPGGIAPSQQADNCDWLSQLQNKFE